MLAADQGPAAERLRPPPTGGRVFVSGLSRATPCRSSGAAHGALFRAGGLVYAAVRAVAALSVDAGGNRLSPLLAFSGHVEP
jgi:hypothetical protein